MAVVNECIPYYEGGCRLTGNPDSAVTGKTFVQVAGPRSDGENILVETCAAEGRSLGVASMDAAEGEKVTIITEGVVPVTAGANITAGQEIESDAAGKAVPLATGLALGLAIDDASSGADSQIKLYS